MIYEFKSRAAGTVVMTQPVGDRILELIGKTPGPQGIVTVEQMPDAIRALEAAVARERAAGQAPGGAAGGRPAGDASAGAKPGSDEREAAEPAVSLAQRAFPFLDLLRSALAAKREITWGA